MRKLDVNCDVTSVMDCGCVVVAVALIAEMERVTSDRLDDLTMNPMSCNYTRNLSRQPQRSADCYKSLCRGLTPISFLFASCFLSLLLSITPPSLPIPSGHSAVQRVPLPAGRWAVVVQCYWTYVTVRPVRQSALGYTPQDVPLDNASAHHRNFLKCWLTESRYCI